MPLDPYISIWEYTVRPEDTAAFIAAYGPAGAWAQLFRKAPGYRGTELYRDRSVPGRFVTVDFWLSPAAYEAFRQAFAAEYQALDAACEAVTSEERPLGTFALADTAQAAL